MRDGILTFEHGEVSLGGKLIPGTLLALAVCGVVRFDKVKQEAKSGDLSGKEKIPHGWEDADVYLDLELTTDVDDGGVVTDCYAKLAMLNATFKGLDNGKNPKVYDVVNSHLAARGISQVVFAALDSDETDEDDVIVARLTFVEHNPPVRAAQNKANASDQALRGAAPPANAGQPAADPNIMQDPGPFWAGYNQWQQ